MDEFAKLPRDERRPYFTEAAARQNLSAQIFEKDFEKATILHRLYHQPQGKPIQPRMSRHYYDVHQLSLLPTWDEIITSIDLLDRVVEQTIVYFQRAWANYDEARTGNLHLSPPERIRGALERDYADMGPMFFGKHPHFDAILARLAELEREINKRMG